MATFPLQQHPLEQIVNVHWGFKLKVIGVSLWKKQKGVWAQPGIIKDGWGLVGEFPDGDQTEGYKTAFKALVDAGNHFVGTIYERDKTNLVEIPTGEIRGYIFFDFSLIPGAATDPLKEQPEDFACFDQQWNLSQEAGFITNVFCNAYYGKEHATGEQPTV